MNYIRNVGKYQFDATGVCCVSWGILCAVFCAVTPKEVLSEEPEVVVQNKQSAAPFRMGFSRRIFLDKNPNDARAALRVWANAAFERSDIPTVAEMIVFRNRDEMNHALRDGLVDFLTMSTSEYFGLDSSLIDGPVLISAINNQRRDVYMLLVRADSGIAGIKDLEGRRLIVYDNPKMCLALLWLETLLHDCGLGAANCIFGQVKRETKLMKVVLPGLFSGSGCLCRNSAVLRDNART